MLGRLLSSWVPHSTHQALPALESVTEETHTRDLLYPEPSSLRHAPHATFPPTQPRIPPNAREAAEFDDRGGLNIGNKNDVRIIIAQEAGPRYEKPQVLYDSVAPLAQPAPPKSAGYERAKQDGSWSRGHGPSNSIGGSPRSQHTRRPSLKLSDTPGPSPTTPRSPEARFRSPFGFSGLSARSSTFEQSTTESETSQARMAREEREELDSLLGCMFGAAGFRLEPGTKIHHIPCKTPDLRPSEKSPAHRPGSSGFDRQRTPLMRSVSAAEFLAATEDEHAPSATPKSYLMITRLFSAYPPESTPATFREAADSDHMYNSDDSQSSPRHGDSGTKYTASEEVKLKKYPMYAVAFIVQLPSDMPRGGGGRRTSQQEASSLGSSYEHAGHSLGTSWKQSFMSLYPGHFRSNDPNINKILAHWNILSRVLNSVVVTARTRLCELLDQQASLVKPLNLPVSSKPGKPSKFHRPAVQTINVDAGCLQKDALIQDAVTKAIRRIVSGLRTRRVVNSQGRWGAWREEARWVSHWAGGRDQNFFFFNLLTAFLGSHTQWIASLRRNKYCYRAKKDSKQDDEPLQQRTIILANDKMAARRLIFLLASFLPGSHPLSYFETLQWPPVLHPYMFPGQSPASSPTIRDPSLRRFSTRPSGARKSEHTRSVSFSIDGQGNTDSNSTDPAQDGGSIRMPPRSASLAIPVNGSSPRKSSTSTELEDTTVPVPHFAPRTPTERPGSSGSHASFVLSNQLKRSESTGLSNTSGSGGRWGSMVSGFWSNRQDSSTDGSDIFNSSSEGLGELPSREALKMTQSRKLSKMVEEASSGSTNQPPRSGPEASSSQPQEGLTAGSTGARSIPVMQKTSRAPLKLSINELDGVIDIELPANNSFCSSLASSYNSSRFQNTTASSFQDHFSPYGRPMTPESPRPSFGEPIIDVAGWLKKYNQDFHLQAVRPYDGLIEEVKKSMLAEAREVPPPNNTDYYSETGLDGNPPWTELSTTLIADTTNFSIRRLTLRRRLRRIPSSSGPPTAPHFQPPAPNTSSAMPPPPSSPAYAYETSIVSTPQMDLDPTLIDAVERILAQSGRSSRAASRAPSRVPSRAPSRAASPVRSGPSKPASININIKPASINTNSDKESRVHLEEGEQTPVTRQDCRRVVMGALEQVFRSVLEEDTDRDREREREVDSTLREGVRRWLESHS